ncbi:Hypothetical predicted protein [Mytilus galloprovincialis]|uniref:EGF-like domain-containing protein n=1 Tax=Mytilus galloprovincialis TaxID=29158 RepID=A0A8B6GBT5_MYTGA|nr:Hypothetical predicted protein [Mytilus galloprovincialis]
MDEFALYVTNTSAILPDGYLCYEDPDPGIPNITQTIQCNQLGKYVIYYDNKGSRDGSSHSGPIVELCYIDINDNMASNGLVLQTPNGSQPGSLVTDGNKTSCTKTEGTPVTFQGTSYELEVCEIGIVMSVFISTKYNDWKHYIPWPGGCPPSLYGPICNQSCPVNCNGPCDLEIGNCVFGCLDGWIGDKCGQGTQCSNKKM